MPVESGIDLGSPFPNNPGRQPSAAPFPTNTGRQPVSVPSTGGGKVDAGSDSTSRKSN